MNVILIVEDMAGVRRSLVTILSSAGYSPVEADNGQTAIEKLKEKTLVDLVITDILMPEADGFELIAYMKRLEARPKVLAISGGGNKVDVNNLLDMASNLANDILQKPFTRDDLLAKVENLLRKD